MVNPLEAFDKFMTKPGPYMDPDRDCNGPTLKSLKGGFWDRPHSDWLIKGTKHEVKSYDDTISIIMVFGLVFGPLFAGVFFL